MINEQTKVQYIHASPGFVNDIRKDVRIEKKNLEIAMEIYAFYFSPQLILLELYFSSRL